MLPHVRDAKNAPLLILVFNITGEGPSRDLQEFVGPLLIENAIFGTLLTRGAFFRLGLPYTLSIIGQIWIFLFNIKPS